MTIGVFLHIDTGVILIGDVNTTGHYPILAGMKGCQVSKWFVGNSDICISRIFQGTFSEG